MHRVFEFHFHTFRVGGKLLWRWGWDRLKNGVAVDLGPVGLAIKSYLK
ncbi:hypothetical protein LCGC14_1897660 [marine sediment metagenome]|uniref:Uncharacterized protein n=1 Tax=marine sediment metagenome TaxID=412755 RepID=A0A0F9GKW4_9ZZZZ